MPRQIPDYWQYYSAIEQDLITTTRYVELTEDNRNTFSIEFARILLAACAEVDVVAKTLCQHIDSTSNASTINSYRPVIFNTYPRFHHTQIELPRYNLTLKPWANWFDQSPPEWWSSHNNVKHHRHTEFHKATMINATLATAGLLAMLLHLYRREHGATVQLQPFPQLLIPEEFQVDYTMWREGPICIWKIPSDDDDRFPRSDGSPNEETWSMWA